MWKVAHALGADPRQVAGVAAVVAADHDHQVERVLVEQRDDGVLALLRRAADRVEGAEVRRQVGLAVAVRHRRAEHLADLQRLGHQHRRLVGAADALEIAVGIEAGGRDASEPRQERRRDRRRLRM